MTAGSLRTTLGRTLRDEDAVVEHLDGVAQAHHERDVVGDHHDGDAPLVPQAGG